MPWTMPFLKRKNQKNHTSTSASPSSSSPANDRGRPKAQPPQPAAASRNNIVPIPSSIRDVDNGRILGFGADLAPDHPVSSQLEGRKRKKREKERREREKERERKREKLKNLGPLKKLKKKNSSPPLPQGFHDRDYKLRRASLAAIARTHVPGTPPPFVAYSSDETAVWSEVFAAASRLYPLAACPEFLRALPALGFTDSAIPQLRDVSETLERKTGWQVRPVAGLMHPRDFLAGLAFKTFHSTQYTRHASRPAYTPVSLIFLSL